MNEHGERIYGEVEIGDVYWTDRDRRLLTFLVVWAVDRLATCITKRELVSYEALKEQTDTLLDEVDKDD